MVSSMQHEPVEFQQIRDLLQESQGGLTPKDFAEKLPLCKNTIAKYLGMMRATGQIDERHIGTTKLYTLSRRVPIDSLLDLVSDKVTVIDQDLKIVQANARILEFLSISKDEIPIGRVDGANLPLLSDPYLIKRVKGALTGRKYKEEIHVRKENADYHLMMQVVPAVSSQGKPAAALLFHDIILP